MLLELSRLDTIQHCTQHIGKRSSVMSAILLCSGSMHIQQFTALRAAHTMPIIEFGVIVTLTFLADDADVAANI